MEIVMEKHVEMSTAVQSWRKWNLGSDGLRILTILYVVFLAAGGCEKKQSSQKVVHDALKDNSEVKKINSRIMLTELELDIDAVTCATPGLFLNREKPPHLRKEEKRPPFMVVPGVKNLALYKPVTTSDEPIIGDPVQLTDGIKTSEEFDFVEGPSWVQVDLGESASIHAIVVWHFYKNPMIYNDVIVRISDDVDFSQNVIMLFNNDLDNSSGIGKGKDTAFISRWWGEIVDARGPSYAGTAARYVRVYTGKSIDGLSPRYLEIAVHGIWNEKKRE